MRVRRSLARRFPRGHRAFNRLRVYASHLRAKHLLRRLQGIPASARAIRSGLRALSDRRAEERLTIGVDIASFWEPLTGIGWYLYRLLEHLADRDDLRIRLYGPTTVRSPDLEPAVVPLPTGPALEPVERRVDDDLVLPVGWIVKLLRRLEPLLIAADGNDVLFAPNYFLPRRFQIARGVRVTTIHDLGLHRVPWTLAQDTLEELKDRLASQIRASRELITVSAAVRDELVELGYAQPSNIHVVHHGPGQLAAVEPAELPGDLPKRFGLHVGTLEPRKNITLLIDLWRKARERLQDCPALVLCGRYGWKSDEIRTAVEKAAEEGWLVHPGYVEDSQLAALYREAEIVVFPTLYEGFGLPAVEALWAGTPVVCSDLPVLRETTGGAALFAPADDPEQFADAVVTVLSDPELRRALIDKGRARVRELSWAKAAERTASVWYRAADRASSNGAEAS